LSSLTETASAGRAGAGPAEVAVVLAVQLVEGLLGLAFALTDLVGVLALGLLVGHRRGLVDAAGDLVAVLVDGGLRPALELVQESHGCSFSSMPRRGRPGALPD
jgi:hypothetical protein